MTKRKRILSIPFVVFAAVILAAAVWLLYRNRSPEATATSNGVLNVLNWDFYIGRNTIPSFEEETRISVNYEKYASNEEALETMVRAPGQYDIVFPSDYMIKIMRQRGVIQPVDTTRIPNIVNVDPIYFSPPFDPDDYCPPYQFGTTGFAVNRGFVSHEDLPDEAVSWEALQDPRWKNRVVVLDDMRFVVGSVLLELGFSPNTTNLEEIEQAVEVLQKVKANIRAFTADTGKDYLLSGDAWIAYAWSGDTLQVQETNPSVKYVIPAFGSLRFQDGICLGADAPNEENAYAFINHLLDPKVSAEITAYTYYGNTNAGAKKYLDPELLDNPALFPPPEVMRRLHFVQDLGEDVALYEGAWERVKG